MTDCCENLEKCGFFKKYNESKHLACLGFTRTYCQGERQCECKRKLYFKENGKAPSDDMMPNGAMVAAA
ncbi:hypothetical protein [uncultured Cohaesibacter sp.]|uniref:hypothetical protein n=1 Tax=uncultured Cohaesibacter sp. TaxID=1002546 RepID=UPI0029316AED|nr:hypothetical protein [uncultured Cohaesibacter sp.]